MRKAYLTIDDSPSARSDDLIDGLVARGVPALLFCRGDLLADNPEAMEGAVQQGMVLGNHGFIHKRAGDLGFEGVVDSIARTEWLIDQVYKDANVTRPGKYFRFPYIDRGDGDLLERRFFDIIAAAQTGDDVCIPQNDAVLKIQEWLAGQGFEQPFTGVSHPLYQLPLIHDAHDCLFTYSTGDWMLNARYKGKQPMQTLTDLTAAMEADPYLMHEPGAQIILVHDHAEITDAVLGLVDYLLNKDFTFEEF